MIIEMKDKEVSSLMGDDVCRVPFERNVLPQYLLQCRWCSSKDAAAPSVTIENSIAIVDLPEARVLILKVNATGTSSYLLPIVTLWQSERPMAGVICELRAGRAVGWLIDGFSEDRFVQVLLDGIRRAEGSPPTGGCLVFFKSPKLEPSFAQGHIGRPGAEQSNTSVTSGEVILKAFRKLEPGVHPELEVGKYLTETARFEGVPTLLGSIEYVCPSSDRRTALCVLQSLIRDGKDGWRYVTENLNQLRKESIAVGASEQELENIASRLGKRTAELHQAFGIATENTAFQPEPISRDWLSQWEGAFRSSIKSVCEDIASASRCATSTARLVRSLLAREGELEAHVKALFPKSTKAKRTRLHGDYHLWQTLITTGDVFIVDFEGEPLRHLDERRGKSLPLRDVAGNLRSLEYASASATQDTTTPSSMVQRLTRRMQSVFLFAYAEAIAGCVSFPEDPELADKFLELFLIEKALYEVKYEMANRPAWINIPIAGLLSAMDGRKHSFKQSQIEP